MCVLLDNSVSSEAFTCPSSMNNQLITSTLCIPNGYKYVNDEKRTQQTPITRHKGVFRPVNAVSTTEVEISGQKDHVSTGFTIWIVSKQFKNSQFLGNHCVEIPRGRPDSYSLRIDSRATPPPKWVIDSLSKRWQAPEDLFHPPAPQRNFVDSGPAQDSPQNRSLSRVKSVRVSIQLRLSQGTVGKTVISKGAETHIKSIVM